MMSVCLIKPYEKWNDINYDYINYDYIKNEWIGPNKIQ